MFRSVMPVACARGERACRNSSEGEACPRRRIPDAPGMSPHCPCFHSSAQDPMALACWVTWAEAQCLAQTSRLGHISVLAATSNCRGLVSCEPSQVVIMEPTAAHTILPMRRPIDPTRFFFCGQPHGWALPYMKQRQYLSQGPCPDVPYGALQTDASAPRANRRFQKQCQAAA